MGKDIVIKNTNPRKNTISTKFTDKEKEQLEKIAQVYKVTVSSLIYQTVSQQYNLSA